MFSFCYFSAEKQKQKQNKKKNTQKKKKQKQKKKKKMQLKSSFLKIEYRSNPCNQACVYSIRPSDSVNTLT